MKSRFIVVLAFLTAAFIFGCKNSDADQVVEIRPDKAGSNAEIIKNPVSAQGIQDTSKLAKIIFEQSSFDFGIINAGQKITHYYKFKNTGATPLIISDARSTCGCTVPEWPKKPVVQGDTSSIKVVFDSDGKKGFQNKPIFIYANTFPAENKIYLTGTVNSTLK